MKYKDLIQDLEERKSSEQENLKGINEQIESDKEELDSKKLLLSKSEKDIEEFEFMRDVLQNYGAKNEEASKEFWQVVLREVVEAIVFISLGLIIISGLGEWLNFVAGAYMALFGGCGLVIGTLKVLFNPEVIYKWFKSKRIKRIKKENTLDNVVRALEKLKGNSEELRQNIEDLEAEIKTLNIDSESKQKLIMKLNRSLIIVTEQLDLAMSTPEASTVLDKHYEENPMMRTLESK